MFGLGQFGDVERCVPERGQVPVLGQWNWFVNSHWSRAVQLRTDSFVRIFPEPEDRRVERWRGEGLRKLR
jgi:hypothetical protein